MNKIILLLAVCGITFTGFSQNGLNFDGINDYIQTNFAGISGAAPRTVEAWINTTANCDPNASGSQKIITDWGSSATSSRFTFCILWANAIRLEVAGNGLSGSIPVNDGNWHHVAAVFDPSSVNYVKLYVDGVLDVEGTLTVPVNTSSSINLRIGLRVDGVNHFDGKIDEVRVWNVARSQTEIMGNMSNELCALSPNLKAYYRFNTGVADGVNSGLNVATDNSGNGYNGNLVNFTLMGSTSNWTAGPSIGGGFTTSSTAQSACDAFTWAANGMTYTNSGNYTVTLPGANSNMCDSIASLNLTINTANDQTTTLSACDSYTWAINGMTYTSTTTVVEPQTTPQGCPFDHTLNLTINSSSSSSMTVSECGPYFWDANGATYTQTGIHTATLSTVNNCDSIVTLDLTITDVTSTVTDNGNGSYSADLSGATYEWIKCTLPSSSTGITTPDFTPTQNGQYALVTTVNNCSDTSACFTVANIGLNEMLASNFTIYPNPTVDNVTIELTDGGVYTYVITDVNGKILFESTEVQATSHTVELNFPAGFYFIQLNQNGRKAIHSIVKK